MVTRTKKVDDNGTPAVADKADVIHLDFTIEPIQPHVLEVDVVGLTPLLVQAWSAKATQQMLDKQMKKANKAKAAKDPEADYKASLYVSTEGWTGIPAGGVKGCLVNACRAVDGLPMTVAKRMIFIHADGETAEGKALVRVYGEHRMNQEHVRISGGTADIRFRAIYPEWSLKLRIEYLGNLISAEQVTNLVNLAGSIEGLCEHRPGAPKSNTGDRGRFRIRNREE